MLILITIKIHNKSDLTNNINLPSSTVYTNEYL